MSGESSTFSLLVLALVQGLRANQALEALLQSQADEWFAAHPDQPRTRWAEFLVSYAVFRHLETLANHAKPKTP